jgi:hypothetical protein
MMRYQSNKPHGRRRTDQQLSADERRRLQSIRQDVEEDDTGMLRRYLRLSKKALELETASPAESGDLRKTG